MGHVSTFIAALPGCEAKYPGDPRLNRRNVLETREQFAAILAHEVVGGRWPDAGLRDLTRNNRQKLFGRTLAGRE